MPSPAGHDAPAHLVTGGDNRLTLLRGGATATAVLAVATSGWSPVVQALVFTAALGCLAVAEWRQRSIPGREFILHPSGRATLDGVSVELLPSAWLTRYYTVIHVRTGHRRLRLLVSSSRQARGEYRKLLTWMRWQPWNSH